MKNLNKKTNTKTNTTKKAVKAVAPVKAVVEMVEANKPKYPFEYIAPEALNSSYTGANYLLRNCSISNLSGEACEHNKHKPAVQTLRDMNFYNDLKKLFGENPFYQFNYVNEQKTQIKKFDNGSLSRLVGLGYVKPIEHEQPHLTQYKLILK